MTIKKTGFHSFCTGTLARGCAMCVKGQKLVIFVTGLCGQRCFYCPISEEKFGKDDVYANEWKISNPENPEEMLTEADMINAKGAGITGGDPLVKTERTCRYIKILKKKYGNKFHIHLYTPLQIVDEKKLRALYEAGLDEIRFHPDLDSELLWNKIKLAKEYNWKIGVEIPVIPGYENKTKKLIDFLEGKIDFLNLNELELSDTDAQHYKLKIMGFKQKNKISYAVKGSKQLAIKLARYAKSKGIITHFCTAKLKDSIQVGNRLKERAKNAALKYDKITDEGMLIRGVLYIKGLEPGFSYRKKIKNADIQKETKKLEEYQKKIIDEKILSKNKIYIDKNKLRIIVPEDVVRKEKSKFKKMGLIPAVTEEYPTSDSFEIEIDFL